MRKLIDNYGYRIVYEKVPNEFYIQRLIKYKSWFGFGKEKQKWVYIKNWYEGSYYPPYSPDYYDKHSFKTLKYAKEHLIELIKKDKLNLLEVVYETKNEFKTNPSLHDDEWDMGIPCSLIEDKR